MIRIWIPSFSNSDDGNNTFADSQIIDDGINYEVIDGSSGLGTIILNQKELALQSSRLLAQDVVYRLELMYLIVLVILTGRHITER